MKATQNIIYKGSKWYKCDLHLHTTASRCFQDQSITADQWVARAIEQGLDCVAITDHNTNEGIAAIQAAAQDTKLTVFPAVEITCDSSKVHLLILFDADKSDREVYKFLIKCDIDDEDFGQQNAQTKLSIFEVAQKAHEAGAIIIPAHIDEFNGLESIGHQHLKDFYDLQYINAVQVVHQDFLDKKLNIKKNTALKNRLNHYYNLTKSPLDDSTLRGWQRTVRVAMDKQLAILTFSDNPHAPQNSKHGLAGIGTRYTWLKMDAKPSLEGLRQAFLSPKFRIKNDFDCPNSQVPYRLPELWIKSIRINNTTITDDLVIDFSPQLTAIIGGRGSGKSSVLRFLRGVFNRTKELQGLPNILQDHKDFYQRENKDKKGVLAKETVIEVAFVRNKILYKTKVCDILNSDNQKVTIEKYDAFKEKWTSVKEPEFIDFFEFEYYSQKQIYEIAKKNNALRERIDKSIEGLENTKQERAAIQSAFLKISISVREKQKKIANKSRLETEIKELNDRISLLHQSEITQLSALREGFDKQESAITIFSKQITQKINLVADLQTKMRLKDFDDSHFDPIQKAELSPIFNTTKAQFEQIQAQLNQLKNQIKSVQSNFDEKITASNWKKDFKDNQFIFDQKKQELEQKGIKDMADFERLMEQKRSKENELADIVELEKTLGREVKERQQLQGDLFEKCRQITQQRRDFVTKVLADEKVKISIKAFKNQSEYIQQFRKILGKENTYNDDFEALRVFFFKGKPKQQLEKLNGLITKIRHNENVPQFSGRFANLIRSIDDEQVDKLEILLPEDEIEVLYKPNNASKFKPLSTASAGQKTTAILTFILSHGTTPLILDQPEDDLDNRLVYELIVDRLKQAKEKRQLIVVTHNANIPVNGDAEYIISMNPESKGLSVLCAGTVEQAAVKKEICDVMEGSEKAFKMRATRYENIME